MAGWTISSTIRTAASSRRPRARSRRSIYRRCSSSTQQRRAQVENNVRAGIARLRGFQQPNGGFVYWPGGWATDYGLGWRDDWGTTYAGHFLLEAERAGFAVPADMKARVAALPEGRGAALGSRTPCAMAGSDQRGRAREAARYAQAYRLFTLALAQQPDLGAMNRLRESPPMSAGERWMLASAYKLANQPDVAAALVKGDQPAVPRRSPTQSHTPSARGCATARSCCRG